MFFYLQGGGQRQGMRRKNVKEFEGPNTKYATFGALGDPTGIGTPGVPVNGVTNGPGVNNRFQGPATPFIAYGGVRFKF